MPRKTETQRRIDVVNGSPIAGGEQPLGVTVPAVGPAIASQPPPTDLTVVGNTILFSAITPLALVSLTWNPPAGILPTSYTIEAATNSTFTTNLVRRVAYQNSAALELPTGTVYYFRVQCVSSSVLSAFSATVSVTTASDTTAPAVPTGLAAAFNAAGDLEILWTNPTTANFRDVEVSIYGDSGFTVLLYREYSARQQIIWTASQNRQAGSGTPDPSVYVRMASRSQAGVLSGYVSPGTQPVKAVPANVSGLVQSWNGDTGTAAADCVITWSAATGASFYRLSIDGASRDIFGTRFVYNFDQNRVEHSGTPDPVLTLSLVGVDGLDQVSATATTATATNAAPAAPTGVTITAFFSTLSLAVGSALPADGLAYRYRLIQTLPSASDITWDSDTPLQTRAISVAATYQVGVKAVDVFGQAGTETLATAVVADALTLSDLRVAARYSDSLSTAPATLKATLADGDLTGTAIAYPTFVAATTIALANTATSVQQTPPSGVAEFDLMLAHVVSRGDGQTITTPTGWTLVPNTLTTDTSTSPDTIHAVFYRFAGATETAPYTFSVSSSNTVGCVIAVYRGVDLTNPINVSNSQVNASSVTITAPSITTTTVKTLLVFLAGSATTQATSPNGSLTEQWEQSGGTNTVGSYGATETQATIAASGTKTATFAAARASIGTLIALAPNLLNGGSSLPYASNAGWVRWVRFERDLLDRYQTITLAMTPLAGTALWYLRTSIDGSTWNYYAGAVTSSRILTKVASAAAAQSAAVASTTLGNSTASRVDLPSIIEARYVELWIQNTTGTTQLIEYYPRRVVQSDDIQAESIRAINILAGSITADRLSVAQLSAIAADMGSITAGTITGATIQTAASGARIELTSANGLRSYDASNVLQAQIRTSDGEMYAGAGDIRLGSYGVRAIVPTTYQWSSSYQFYETTGNSVTGALRAFKGGSTNGIQLVANRYNSPIALSRIDITADGGTSNAGKVELAAYGNNAGSSATITVNAPSSGTATTVVLDAATTTVTGVLQTVDAVQPPRSSGAAVFALDATAQGSSITLANNATTTPVGNANNFGGLIIVHETAVDGSIAMFLTGGGQVAEISDPSGHYSAVASTASSTNVWLSGSVVVLENKRGGSRTYNLFALRLRTSN